MLFFHINTLLKTYGDVVITDDVAPKATPTAIRTKATPHVRKERNLRRFRRCLILPEQ